MGGSEEITDKGPARGEISKKVVVVCLVSGGMDSGVTAAIAHEENDEIAFLHISYGQRTERRERECFDKIADHYRVEARLVVTLEQLALIGGSSLTDQRMAVTPADLDARRITSSYIPFRNSHLLATAVSWGEVIGSSSIYIG